MAQTVEGFYPFQERKNVLLVKDDVGKAKPVTVKLPPLTNVYGKKALSKEEGVSQVTREWKFHEQTRPKIPERDFKQLNKLGVQQGIFKPKDLTMFRSQTDARVKVIQGQNSVPIYLPEDQFRYGIKNKPSTPMEQVMGNVYGLRAQQDVKQYYNIQKQTGSFKKPQMIPKGTKAQVLYYSYQKQLQQQKTYQQNHKDIQFKLSKFKTVPSKIVNKNIIQKQKAKTLHTEQNQQELNQQQDEKQQAQENNQQQDQQ